MKQSGPARHTKYLTEMYKSFRDVDEITKTANFYRQSGNYKQAQDLINTNRDKLRFKTSFALVRKQLTSINSQVKRIWRDPIMTAAQKKSRIDTLTERRNRLISGIYKRYRQ